MTLLELENGRNNNIGLIRFIAASLVIFSHCYWLTCNELREPLMKLCGMETFGSLGVDIFFSISGFLITKSLFRQASLQSFVWARILRIFPGLIASALFCALIIGPIATTLPLSGYFKHPDVYDFIWRQSTLLQYPNKLPGVFTQNPIVDNINSPIWTLPGELFMYMLVFVTGVIVFIAQKKAKIIPSLVLLCPVLAYFWAMQYSSVYLNTILWWLISFGGGAICYIFRKNIHLSTIAFIVMVVCFLVLFHFRFIYIRGAFDIVLLYGLLVFAYEPKLQFKPFYKMGDLSYGLYIYALPIQQLIIQKNHILIPYQLFLITYPIALCLAELSWYFIEKPSLKLKSFASIRASAQK